MTRDQLKTTNWVCLMLCMFLFALGGTAALLLALIVAFKSTVAWALFVCIGLAFYGVAWFAMLSAEQYA